VSQPAPPTVLDHLVVVAPDLDAGSDVVDGELGVRPAPGGRHERMGTHNLLLRTGESTYAEVIAVDPDADAPAQPRWFDLDHATDVRLATWVVRTADIDATTAAAAESPGVILDMARGDVTWRVTVPTDGTIPLDGVGPHVIQWDGDPAATRMPPSPVRLISLTIAHPDPQRVRAQLASLDLVGPVTVQQDFVPHLIAAFETPAGPRVMTGLGGDSLSIDRERQIAMDLFNLTWTYLDMDARSSEHDGAMVQTAEASRWHWQHVGTPTQFAIGEWQCSRVHAVLGDGERARAYAQRCLEITRSERVEDFVPASAHEALARAYAVLGDMEAAREQRNLAYRIAVDLDNEDRDVIEHDLGTLPIT